MHTELLLGNECTGPKRPLLQGTHISARVELLHFPAGHRAHCFAENWFAKRPGVHSLHFVEARRLAYVPGMHSSQSSLSQVGSSQGGTTLLNLPRGQSVQPPTAVAFLKRPWLQHPRQGRERTSTGSAHSTTSSIVAALQPNVSGLSPKQQISQSTFSL